MKISEIDKDFEDIIYYLDKSGFKPFASCDGVEAHHANANDVSDAYISFIKSSRIIELLAEFLKEKGRFNITLESENHFKPYELYGNIISGTKYSVHFTNRKGENTQYFKSIIKRVIENQSKTLTNEQVKLHMLEKVLEENLGSNLSFEVSFNGEYQPYMRKTGTINELIIRTKHDNENHTQREIDMNVLASILAEKYNISKRTATSLEYIGTEFIIPCIDKSSCSIYFTDEHFNQILEIIRYSRQIEHTLPTFEYIEWLGSDDEYDEYDEYDQYNENDEYEEYEGMFLSTREEKLPKLEKEVKDYSREDDER